MSFDGKASTISFLSNIIYPIAKQTASLYFEINS